MIDYAVFSLVFGLMCVVFICGEGREGGDKVVWHVRHFSLVIFFFFFLAELLRR